MADVMANTDYLDAIAFISCDLPDVLDVPRDAIVSYAVNNFLKPIKYLHYVEGYYLLAKNING